MQDIAAGKIGAGNALRGIEHWGLLNGTGQQVITERAAARAGRYSFLRMRKKFE
jgi:hypothetical protein